MNKRIIYLLAALTFVLFAVMGCGSQPESSEQNGEKIVIKFSHVTTDNSPKGQAALYFKQLVEERSNGRIEVEVFPSSQLYGDSEELEALIANNVQLIAPSATKLVGFNPSFQIFDLPFLFKDNEAVYKFFEAPDGGQKLLNSLQDKGILGLAYWPNGFKQFTNSKRPLTKPEDFQGLKFRTQTGQILSAQMEALGAAAQPLPFAEVYTALQQGTVEGQENTFNNIDTQSYAEVQKYLTVSNHGRIDYVVLTNTTFWNSLSEDDQNLIRQAMYEATDKAVELAEALDNESFNNIKNTGKVEIYELNDQEQQRFQEAMQPVWEQFAGVIGQDLIDVARSMNQ